MTGPDPDLTALLRAVAERLGPQQPAPSLLPAADESEIAWRARIARARAAAGRRAVQHARLVAETSQALFGHTVAEILPPAAVPITRGTLCFRPDLTTRPLPDSGRHGLGAIVPPSIRVADHLINPAPELTVRRTCPPAPQARIVFLHGGSFWMGGGNVSAEIDQNLIDQLAAQSNAEVLNLDYRLAPENPVPASIADALAAIEWATAASQDDGLPVGVLGISSGANLATLAARANAANGGQPPLAALALVVPSVLLCDAPAELRADHDAWAARTELLHAYTGASINPDHPWVSPAVENRITGLPDTLVVLAEHDEIAMGGEALAKAIRAGGSAVTCRSYPMTHGTATPQVEAAIIDRVVSFFTQRFQG